MAIMPNLGDGVAATFMAEDDLYQLLGVARTADDAQLKQAFRKLARQLHPDRNPGDKAAEERFKKVSFAFEVLADAKKRKLYDEFGLVGLKEGFDPNAFRHYRGVESTRGGMPGGHEFRIEDLFGERGAQGVDFSQFFGGNLEELLGGQGVRGRARQSAAPRRDVEVEITLPLGDALRGCDRDIEVQAEPSSKSRRLRVHIPAGIADGGKVRLRGQAPGPSRGKGGDLILRVQVESHPWFWRQGDDLHVTLPLTPLEAYRGTQIAVPTASKAITLRIPAGTQSGTKLRARGRGVANRQGGQGDLIAHVEVHLPPKGDAQVEEIVSRLEEHYVSPLRTTLEL